MRCRGFPGAGAEGGVHVGGDEDGSGKHLESFIIWVLQKNVRIEKEGSIDVRMESILREGSESILKGLLAGSERENFKFK
jgi:hypothetical protein